MGGGESTAEAAENCVDQLDNFMEEGSRFSMLMKLGFFGGKNDQRFIRVGSAAVLRGKKWRKYKRRSLWKDELVRSQTWMRLHYNQRVWIPVLDGSQEWNGEWMNFYDAVVKLMKNKKKRTKQTTITRFFLKATPKTPILDIVLPFCRCHLPWPGPSPAPDNSMMTPMTSNHYHTLKESMT